MGFAKVACTRKCLISGVARIAVISPLHRQQPETIFTEAYSAVFGSGERYENSVIHHLLEAADGEVNPVQTEAPDPRTNAAHLLEIAEWLEADRAGITELSSDHRTAVEAAPEQPEGPTAHRFAISLLKRIGRGRRGSLNMAQQEQLRHTELALIACILADYIRELGFPARAHHVLNSRVLHEPIAAAAGLGDVGRNSGLVANKYGPGVCVATVTTDMPLVPDAAFPRRLRSLLPGFLRATR
jgi:epoxyqueuosine reductase QueG